MNTKLSGCSAMRQNHMERSVWPKNTQDLFCFQLRYSNRDTENQLSSACGEEIKNISEKTWDFNFL